MFQKSNSKFKVILVLVLIIISGGVYSFFSKDDKVTQNKSEVKTTKTVENNQKNFYTAGQYKVGSDISAGEYLAFGTGYIEVSSDSASSSIICNDNIKSFQYISVRNGEYLKITDSIKLYSVADAPKIDADKNNLTEGQYKVGQDISAGEYDVTTQGQGYFEVTTDSRKQNIIKNQFMPNAENAYVTVFDGQYLKLQNANAKFVGATKANTSNSIATNVTQTSKILNLGMNIEQFKFKFNDFATKNNVGFLSIGNTTLKTGSVQDIFQYNFSENLILQGSVDKTNGLVKEVWLLGSPKTENDSMMLMSAYSIVASILNPELFPGKVGDLMKELKIDGENINSLKTSNGQAFRGNIKYTTQFINGIFNFIASAKDI